MSAQSRIGVVAFVVAAAAAFGLGGLDVQADLVGYWDFDEGSGTMAVDSTRYGNTGALVNTGGVAWDAGHTGGWGDFALRFGGTNGVVNIPDHSSISVTGDLTLSAWINPAAPGGGQHNIVAKDSNNSYRWRLQTGTGDQWLLLNDGAGSFQVISSGDTPAAGAWQHAAMTVDFAANAATFYLNGAPRVTLPVTETGIQDSGGALCLGAYNTGGGESFNGAVDDVAIWNEKLSGSQIAALAAGASPSSISAAPRTGTIQLLPITSDADSGISSDKIYAHAIDPGTGNVAVVNDVGFTLARTGNLPMANFDYQVSGSSRNEHGGNSDHDVTGGVADLFQDMVYNGNNPAGGTATITLSGLTPGAVYDTRLYARQWDAGSIRQATVGFDINGDGAPDNWVPVDQNHASSVGFADDRQAYAISYRFTAESDHVDISLRQALGNQSWHLYGVTNEIVRPAPDTIPVRALITADNHYQVYLSPDDNVLGTLIAQSGGGSTRGDWETPETLGFLVPSGETMYLHLVVTNDDPPSYGGLIAHLGLPENYLFEVNMGEEIDTGELLWLVNDTGFGDPMVSPTAHGAYGAAPWGTTPNPDFPGTAQWVWLGPVLGQDAGTLYFSVPITARYIPEPGTLALLGLGALGLARRRRRKPHASRGALAPHGTPSGKESPMARNGNVVRMLVVLAVAFGLGLLAPAANASLVGYWTFDDTVNDASDYNNHGTAGGSPTYSTEVPTAIGTGKSLDFNGSTDYVSVVPTGAVKGSYTVSAWARVRDTAARTMFATRQPSDASFDMKFDGGYRIHGDIGNGSGWINTSADANPFNYNTNQWYHVAYVVSPTSYQIYADGSPVGSGSFGLNNPVLYDASHHIKIGCYTPTAEQFNGQIDDVAVWDHRLTAGQISALASGASPSTIAASPGTFAFKPITNDADSGLSLLKTYTHALDFGTHDNGAFVNGVPFTQAGVNTLPAGVTYDVTSGSRNDHGGNGNDNVTGRVENLFYDMIYNNGNAAGGTAALTLSGLQPGTEYTTRIYTRQWGAGTRTATVGFDIDGDSVPDDQVTVSEDDATRNPPGFGAGNQAYALSYTFTAQSSDVQISFNQQNPGTSWHVYGVTNEETEPSGRRVVPGVYSSGMDDNYNLLTPGTPDPHFELIVSAAGGAPMQALKMNPHPAYLADDGLSGWIGPVVEGTSNIPAGDYVYKTLLNLSGFDPESVQLSLAIAVDDAVDDILLNGESIGFSASGFAAFGRPLLITDGFIGGMNTLEFLSRNGGVNPHGFRVEMYATGRIPEPATLSLLSLGGLGLLARRRRKPRR